MIDSKKKKILELIIILKKKIIIPSLPVYTLYILFTVYYSLHINNDESFMISFKLF